MQPSTLIQTHQCGKYLVILQNDIDETFNFTPVLHIKHYEYVSEKCSSLHMCDVRTFIALCVCVYEANAYNFRTHIKETKGERVLLKFSQLSTVNSHAYAMKSVCMYTCTCFYGDSVFSNICFYIRRIFTRISFIAIEFFDACSFPYLCALLIPAQPLTRTHGDAFISFIKTIQKNASV